MFVDSHCHLNYLELSSRLDDVVKHANLNGIKYLMTVNTKLSETSDVIAISERYPNIFCTVGVHPNDTAEHQDLFGEETGKNTLLEKLTVYAKHPKIVGLGETGLDYHYETSPRSLQQKSFAVHLEASENLDLPVVIHTRDADEDTLMLIQQYPKATGVFHCFSGDMALAKAALDLGYYISFSGIITFKTAQTLREVVQFVPIERMLIETDSPYLAPVPHRGKSNEPAWTLLVAEQVSKLKNIPLEDVGDITTKNYFTLFNKAKPIF